MAGGVASALADASRRGGRALAGDLGLFEVDEFWLGPVVERARARARCCSANLFRDQLDRYGELEIIADRWADVVARDAAAALVLNADDPLVADLGRATRDAASTSASTTTRSRSPSSSTRPTPSTAGAAATPTSTTRSTSRTSAATTARTAARAARTRPWWRATSSCAASAPRRSRCTRPAGDRARRAPAARPLQRLQRARRRRALPRARRAARRRRRRAGGRRARVRARRDGRARRPPDVDPAGQEPGRRERGAAHARARGRRARPVRRPQRPHGRRARRLLGLGRRLGAARAARAADDVLRHARGRARAADEVRGRATPSGCTSSSDLEAASTRALAGRRRARSTRCRPTRRCSSCATCWPRAAQVEGHWR